MSDHLFISVGKRVQRLRSSVADTLVERATYETAKIKVVPVIAPQFRNLHPYLKHFWAKEQRKDIRAHKGIVETPWLKYQRNIHPQWM